MAEQDQKYIVYIWENVLVKVEVESQSGPAWDTERGRALKVHTLFFTRLQDSSELGKG